MKQWVTGDLRIADTLNLNETCLKQTSTFHKEAVVFMAVDCWTQSQWAISTFNGIMEFTSVHVTCF